MKTGGGDCDCPLSGGDPRVQIFSPSGRGIEDMVNTEDVPVSWVGGNSVGGVIL